MAPTEGVAGVAAPTPLDVRGPAAWTGSEPLMKPEPSGATMFRSLSFLSLLTMAACGGGGSDGPVAGLQAPQQVTIVEASGSTTASLRLPGGSLGSLLPVAGSDYETAVTRFWVEDDSMRALDTVNMILSSLQQTRYWEQTNAGPYRALVAEEERGGGERGNNATEYQEWIIDSTRANGSAPQVVGFWLEQDDTMGEPVASLIYGRLTVVAEPSAAQPLGQFTLQFKNLPLTEPADSANTGFEGYLRTVPRQDGQSELEFYMSHGDVDGTPAVGEYAMRDRVHVVGDPTTDSGRAYTETRFKRNTGTVFSDGGEFQIQFDADYLARRDVTNGNTLAVLDRNDFTTRVYRYGVYDATTEDLIEQQSGFPIEDADGENGWAGFYGIWFPPGTGLVNGQAVFRRSFQTNTTTAYTVFIAPGRLERRSRSAITLGDLVGEVMEYFDPNGGGEQRVVYDGTDFVRVATRTGNSWTPENPPVSIASSFTTGQWLGLWSQARGSVEFEWPATLGNSVPAFVWSSTTIDADAPELANGDLTLHGYFRMLRANITANQANFVSSETPYLPDATAVNSGNTVYTFEKASLLLRIGADPVKLADGVTVTQGPGLFGFDCGPLFANALPSLAEVGNQTTTYQWYTGANEWNQLRTLKDGSGNFVQFDPPIRFAYVHDEAGSPYDGRTFFLEWDGANLGGIPYEEDPSTNRYYPAFNIPTGSTVTAGQATYKIKQLEGEQFMVEVGDPATVYAARGFDIDGTPITAPSAAPYQDPAIGARPTVTAAPKYVGGVPQTTDG